MAGNERADGFIILIPGIVAESEVIVPWQALMMPSPLLSTGACAILS